MEAAHSLQSTGKKSTDNVSIIGLSGGDKSHSTSSPCEQLSTASEHPDSSNPRNQPNPHPHDAAELPHDLPSKCVSLDVLQLPRELTERFAQYSQVQMDGDCSTLACEGLFDGRRWGSEFVGLHRMVHRLVWACPVDMRRTLFANVYLVGGLGASLRGLPQRLQHELSGLLGNSNIQVQVRPHISLRIDY